MTQYYATFDGPVKLPTDQRMQYFSSGPSELLPHDGLPRITALGMEILLEGLRGDFSRWKWSIGNHPLELPSEHVSNIQIRAMKDEPHFIADFWYGPDYPVVKYHVFTPRYCFDEVDTLTIGEDPIRSIHLRQTSDYWAYCPIAVENHHLWTEAEHNRFKGTSGPVQDDDEDDEEFTECTPCRKGACTLDAWMEAGE